MIAGPFVYQAKLRRGLPSCLRDWLRGIVAAGERSGTTGVVVWKAPRALDDDAVVVLRLKDWQALHGPDKEKPALVARALGRESGRVVQGTQTNASAHPTPDQPLLFAPGELLACGLRDAHTQPLVGRRTGDGVRSWRTSPARAWHWPLVEWTRTGQQLRGAWL